LEEEKQGLFPQKAFCENDIRVQERIRRTLKRVLAIYPDRIAENITTTKTKIGFSKRVG